MCVFEYLCLHKQATAVLVGLNQTGMAVQNHARDRAQIQTMHVWVSLQVCESLQRLNVRKRSY